MMPVVPGALIATAALNVPAPPSAVGLTLTWNDPGTAPEVGFTVNQFALLLVLPVAVNAVMLGLLLETFTVWVSNTLLPGTNVKLTEFGLAESGLVPVELALRVTGMLRDPEEEMTLMKPALVPDVGAPEPTETIKDSGVTPLAGVTLSQLLAELAVTTTVTGELDVTRMLCAVGVTPFCVLKVSCWGLALRAF